MDFPSGDISYMVFKSISRLGDERVSLDGRMLAVLTALDGKRPLADVAKATGMDLNLVKDVISDLMEMNLVEQVEEIVSGIDREFWDYLRDQLVLAVGPIGEVLIEDAVDGLGYTVETLPAHRAAELVDSLAREIQRKDRRSFFQQHMVAMLKEKGY